MAYYTPYYEKCDAYQLRHIIKDCEKSAEFALATGNRQDAARYRRHQRKARAALRRLVH